MSNHYYGFYVPCAFVFTPEVIKAIADYRMKGKFSDEDIVGMTIEELDTDEELPISYVCDFAGECRPISSEAESIDYQDDCVFYIESNKDPSLFHQAYQGMHEDLVPEFRKKLEGFLPDDFPIENHLYTIVGTIYC